MKKYIEGTKECYVDEDGTVYGSLGKPLKGDLTKAGYLRVVLYLKNGSKIRESVHRLVAKEFIPNPENKPFVNHKDGNKINNCVDNLEWVTPKENGQHASENGLLKFVGENHYNSKYTESLVREICERLESGERVRSIAKDLGIPPSQVSMIRCGQSWRHISKQYNIKVTRALRPSEETIRWICRKLEEGFKPLEILEMAYSKAVTRGVVYNISSRTSHKNISSEYNF